MTTKRWAPFFGILAAAGFSLSTQAAGELGYDLPPSPYMLWINTEGSGSVLYDMDDIYPADDEECSRSGDDRCSVWFIDSDGALLDVTNIMAFAVWEDTRTYDYEIIDYEAYYYDVGAPTCWGKGCEVGQWSEEVDWTYDQYDAGYPDTYFYGMAEWGDPSSARGPFDYDEATPIARFVFTLEQKESFFGDHKEWSWAFEIWTETGS